MVEVPDPVDDRMYVPVWAAAQYLGRSQATIRQWARTGQVRYRSGPLRVHLVDAGDLDETAGRRTGGRNIFSAEACQAWILDKLRSLNA